MKKTVKVLVTSLVINCLLVIFKTIFGLIGKSQALIADAIHSLSDFSTDIVGIIGLKSSVKPADEGHPYGHGKIEYVTSIIMGSIIFILGIILIIDIFTTATKIPTSVVAIVITMDTIIKYFLAKYIINKGKKYKNNILISSGKESFMDVISSLVVLLMFILSRFSSDLKILKYTDKFGGIIIGLMIIKISLDILIENAKAVLGQIETEPNFIENVKNNIIGIDNVESVDDLKVLKFGSYYQVILSIGIDENKKLIEGHDIAHQVEANLKEKIIGIKYVTVHVNPYIKENN